MRADAYSEVYLISDDGSSVTQLSHNQTASSTIQLNHWMFWPHVAADGHTLYVTDVSGSRIVAYELRDGVLTAVHSAAVGATPVHVVATLDGRSAPLSDSGDRAMFHASNCYWLPVARIASRNARSSKRQKSSNDAASTVTSTRSTLPVLFGINVSS